MSKNIAVFIDGTWNEPNGADAVDNTNVYKLFMSAVDDATQRTWYRKGIGRDRWPFRIPKIVRNLIGGAFGLGMSDLIKDAYRFLSSEYEIGDSVYLFGFSRGAFAARSLAGFAEAVGLLFRRDANDNHLEEAYALYENGYDPQHTSLRQYLRQLEFPKVVPDPEDGTTLPIYFIGVWDTVGALGLPGRIAWFSAPFTEFHQTELPKNVTHARHVLAIHEFRPSFKPLLWESTAKTGQTLRQTWFPGTHADVGGGYKDRDDWSRSALDCMASEASKYGLKLRSGSHPGVTKDPSEPFHNSISGLFATDVPTIRESLLEPDNSSARTRQTFAIHPLVTRRLLRNRSVPYQSFESVVASSVDDADDCALRLRIKLGLDNGSSPSAARETAIRNWWDEPHAARLHDYAAYVDAFLERPGSSPLTELETFRTALSRCLLCDDEESLKGRFDKVSTACEATWPKRLKPATFSVVEEWLAWLEAVANAVRATAAVMPDDLHALINTLAARIDSDRDALTWKLIDARLRASRI